MIVHDGKLDPFIRMANSPLLEYRRTAAVAMASFTLHEANKGERTNQCIHEPNSLPRR